MEGYGFFLLIVFCCYYQAKKNNPVLSWIFRLIPFSCLDTCFQCCSGLVCALTISVGTSDVLRHQKMPLNILWNVALNPTTASGLAHVFLRTG